MNKRRSTKKVALQFSTQALPYAERLRKAAAVIPSFRKEVRARIQNTLELLARLEPWQGLAEALEEIENVAYTYRAAAAFAEYDRECRLEQEAEAEANRE
mgnify:FL=1